MPSRSPVHDCIVPGCSEIGRNQLGVRCRIAHNGASPFPEKRRTHALFSIESDAYLCDSHALSGVSIVLSVDPNRSGEAGVAVVCGTSITDVRSIEIKQPITLAA